MEKFKNRRQRNAEKVQSKKSAVSAAVPWYKKRSFIISGIVVAVAVVAVLTIIITATVTSGNRTEALRTAREASVGHLANLESNISDLSPQERAEALTAWSDSLSEVDCDNLISLPWLADERQQCDNFNKTQHALQAQLAKVRDILLYDIALQTALQPVTERRDVEDIAQEAATWNEAAERINELPHREMVAEVQARLLERVGIIQNTWAQLETANREENNEAFREIEASLPEKYSNLQMIREELSRLYAMEQGVLVEAASSHHS